GNAARPVIRGAPVLVEGTDRLDVVSLAIGFGTDAARLLNRSRAGFQRRLTRRVPQRVPYAHRHAPLRHGTSGIRFAHGSESLDGFGVPERMQHRDGAIELLLRGRAAGDGEMNLPDMCIAALG